MPNKSTTDGLTPRAAAQLGNQNAKKKNARHGVLSIRVKTKDKAGWVKAANRARKLGLLDQELREGTISTLPAWVTKHLNAAVKAEEEAAKNV